MTITAVEGAIRQVRKQLEDYPFKPDKEGHEYRYNEVETRYALIDPIIRALGWELSDFDQCAYEADPKWKQWMGRDADYVFWGQEKEEAVWVLEAKRVRNELKSGAEEAQLAGYVSEMESGMAVLSNGRTWYLYNLKLAGTKNSEIRKVEEVHLLNDDLRDAARKLHEQLDVGNWWPDKRCQRCRYHRDEFGCPGN